MIAIDSSSSQSIAKLLEENEDVVTEPRPTQVPWPGKTNFGDSMRIRADSEIIAFRNLLLPQPAERGSVEWKATDPTLFRLAVIRLVNENRIAELTESVDSAESLERLETARQLYKSSRRLSPLDWRLIWGETLCDWRSSKIEQMRKIATLGVVSANKPTLLFKMGLISNELGEQSFAMNLWKIAMQAQPSLSTKVARLFATTKKDEEIDVAIFPNNLSLMESVATVEFPRNKFPITNDRFWKRIEDEAKKLSAEDTNRWVWMAKSAKAANNEKSEFEFLEKALLGQPYSNHLRQRLAVLLANRGDFERALNEISSCLHSNPNDPSLQKLQQQVQELSETSLRNR